MSADGFLTLALALGFGVLCTLVTVAIAGPISRPVPQPRPNTRRPHRCCSCVTATKVSEVGR